MFICGYKNINCTEAERLNVTPLDLEGAQKGGSPQPPRQHIPDVPPPSRRMFGARGSQPGPQGLPLLQMAEQCCHKTTQMPGKPQVLLQKDVPALRAGKPLSSLPQRGQQKPCLQWTDTQAGQVSGARRNTKLGPGGSLPPECTPSIIKVTHATQPVVSVSAPRSLYQVLKVGRDVNVRGFQKTKQ